jgi:hypothetical protein
MILCAQEPPAGGGRGRGPATPPKNLKVLPADGTYMTYMRQATAGLGVQCTFCHEQDRSLDSKPEKLTARMMFQMVMDINSKMPDAKIKVTCFTCHRGAQEPLSAPPAAQ